MGVAAASTAANQSEFVIYVTEQLQRWAPVSARRLFGGNGIYRGDTIFGIVSRDTLFFRTDEVNQPDFVAAGMGPFRVKRPGKDFLSLAYYEVPADIIEDPELLAQWAGGAFAAALRRGDAQAAKNKRARGNRKRKRPLKQRKD
jgi:DNA transformation protein